MYVYKSVAKSMVTNAHHIINSALIGSRSPAGPRRRRKRTHAIGVHPLPPAVLSVTISLATQSRTVDEGGKAPISPCVPLCAIFLRRPSVYPLLTVKANVGHLCEKLKTGMKSGLKQRCGGNFLAIFAGTVLDEKAEPYRKVF